MVKESLMTLIPTGPSTSVERRRAVDFSSHKRGLSLFSDCVVPHATDAALPRQTTCQNISGYLLKELSLVKNVSQCSGPEAVKWN